MDNTGTPKKEKTGFQILKTGLWFAGIFVVGLLFKLMLNLTYDGKNPIRAENAIIEGVEYISKQNYKAAIEQFDKAIKLDSTNSYSYLYRGHAYLNIKMYDKALVDFNKAISRKNNDFELFIYQGQLYYIKEQFSLAFDNYSKSIEIMPTADAYVGLGNIFLKMNKLDKAIINFSYAIDLMPDSAELYSIRGNTYNQLGKINEAINDFNKAIELNPNEPIYKQNLSFSIKLKSES